MSADWDDFPVFETSGVGPLPLLRALTQLGKDGWILALSGRYTFGPAGIPWMFLRPRPPLRAGVTLGLDADWGVRLSGPSARPLPGLVFRSGDDPGVAGAGRTCLP